MKFINGIENDLNCSGGGLSTDSLNDLNELNRNKMTINNIQNINGSPSRARDRNSFNTVPATALISLALLRGVYHSLLVYMHIYIIYSKVINRNIFYH